MKKYKVIINEGLGFTEIIKSFNNLTKACLFAGKFEFAKIYKNKLRIF